MDCICQEGREDEITITPTVAEISREGGSQDLIIRSTLRDYTAFVKGNSTILIMLTDFNLPEDGGNTTFTIVSESDWEASVE